MQTLDAHRSALRQFGDRVAQVRDDQWGAPTPDPGWTVRDLVGHLTGEQLWVPELLAGRTVREIGDRFSGDVLGDDPVAAWTAAATAARAAWTEPGALDRTVQLSAGPTPALDYLQEMTLDLAVHAWDLARAIGATEDMPNDLVSEVLDLARRIVPRYADAGIFAAALDVASCTDDLTELLALTGRRR
ncbi:TIGR03086 family metal-binding protein [Nakamurella endophytica]|uniref:TIGR03086 family metal-binding protein n=1 Tax=Nakamurella endophytica TaxID=1748367 RepID=UPI00166CC2E3|nr:TIGR03086 family metal-binding protein [Nakamurella endophytica]